MGIKTIFSNFLNSKWFNLILFQATWWFCVAAGKNGFSNTILFGVIISVLALHYITQVRNIKAELIFHLGVLGSGLVVDTLLLKLGVFSFSLNTEAVLLEPWLIAMWALFPILFNHSISWMKQQTGKQFILGGLGGLSSYWGGQGLGLLVLNSAQAVLILFFVWALIVVLSFYFLERLLKFFSPKM